MNNGILLFVKYPQTGQVKTRLAAGIGVEHALELYRCFLDDLYSTLSSCNAELVVCYSPDDAAVRTWAVSRFPNAKLFHPQQGDDLGERMHAAFEFGFQTHDKLLLIGGDTPHLSMDLFDQAFEALDRLDCVLGPSTDGGYYLIGFRNNATPIAFQNIDWSTSRVLTQTLNRLESASKSVFLLPERVDIDEQMDLEPFLSTAKNSLKSVQYIINHHII